MPGRLSEHGLFFREFLRNFHTTGAILPSGRFLAAALSRFVCENGDEEPAPRRLLEVGAGTGAVTRRIVLGLKPHDRLDLVESNESFANRLRQRLQTEPVFQAARDRVRVLHTAVEELAGEVSYDLIVSGLPLNNFSVADVQRILDSLVGMLKPGGTLSFFEYIAIRRLRWLVSGRAERQRLRGIGSALEAVLAGHEIRRDWVWANVPPAWVHHVRID